MTVYLDDGDVQLYHGDAIAVLSSLPAGIAQTCITSPPYWGLRDYGTGTWTGGDADCPHTLKGGGTAKSGLAGWGNGLTQETIERKVEGYGHAGYRDVCGRCGARRTDDQLGLEPTPQEYVERIVGVFREVRRCLRDDGTLWLNLGDSYAASGATGHGGWDGNNKNPDGSPRRNRQAGDEWMRSPTAVSGLKAKDLVGIPWSVAKAMQEPYYTGKIRDERDRVWLAAIVEAEGCLFIHKRKAGQSNGQGYSRKNDSYGSGLEVSSTDRVIVERCMAITGLGSVCEQTPEQNERRKQTIYRWNLRTNECRDVIRELYPHMIAKQHEARLLIGCPSSGDDARKAHESLKALHQGQAASIDFREPEGMWERGWFLRSEIIWAKCMPNPMPESVTDRPTKSHETIFLFSKQPRYFYDADAIREPNTSPEQAEHNAKYARTYDAHTERVTNGQGIQPGNVNNLGIHARGGATSGRNRRSVWVIPTEPFPEAHFATYPQALVAPCILAGTSERGECADCGAPWQRQTEAEYVKSPVHGAGSVVGRHYETGANGYDGAGMPRLDKKVTTTGWQPSCACHETMAVPPNFRTRPQLVLDPFIGSGTTALVARKHGRRCIGIDLSLDYLKIAAERTRQLSLLGSG